MSRFVFDQTGAGSASHHGPVGSPLGETTKKWLPAVAWRRGVVTIVVVVVVAPKWNEQRKNEPGMQGAREGWGWQGAREPFKPMGSTYPFVVVVGRTSGRRWWWRIHAL